MDTELFQPTPLEIADVAKQLGQLAGRLLSPGRPGHVDYISKHEAAEVVQALVSSLRQIQHDI